MTPTLGDSARDASVTERVLSAVANERNVDVTELEPLYDTVDPDALEALVAPGIDGHVTFSYHDLQVMVHGDGSVEVDENDVLAVASPA